jgi:hypothetical protein
MMIPIFMPGPFQDVTLDQAGSLQSILQEQNGHPEAPALPDGRAGAITSC